MLEYAQGVINVLEKSIFDKLDLQRMMSASDSKEAFKVLFDTDLGREAASEEKIESILQRDLENLKQSLFAMLKDVKIELFYFLFLRLDALDIKIALKEGKEPKPENEYAKRIIELSYSEQGSIDEKVDKAYLKVKLLLAKKVKGAALEIAKYETDIANLKNLIKNKEGFIKGGNLSCNDMLKLLGQKRGMISRGLEKFLESFDLSLIIEEFEKTGSESDLEKGLEKFLAKRVLQREREGGGVEKVMGFFFRKMNAHSNIRLIFFEKEAGLTQKEIENNLLPI
jgi:vacuolar-type H+-ATPase subunit C/Vma6